MHQEWGFIYAVDIFKITLIYRLKAEILTRSLRTIHVYIYIHTYIYKAVLEAMGDFLNISVLWTTFFSFSL